MSEKRKPDTGDGIAILVCYCGAFVFLASYDGRLAIAWFLWRLGHTIGETIKAKS